MSAKDLIIKPLLELEANMRRETGTTPTITMVIHSSLFDDLLAEVAPEPRLAESNAEEIRLGHHNDIVIKPRRSVN